MVKNVLRQNRLMEHLLALFQLYAVGQFSLDDGSVRTACQHIAPLVVAAELHIAAVIVVEVQEIIGLHDLM